ncbi:hypothetical protein [Candidatus Amoebophilus asiaticus]|uniref:hypothetical protein n=1 Tax=Candidatus Amoebophilus asiaticus TaxID=281120 RepID=UPI0001715EC0|nr:hypothetical protein [Candidatus Amoebophilus asiaticus]
MCNQLPIIVCMLFALGGCTGGSMPQEPKSEPNNRPISNTKGITNRTTTFNMPILQQQRDNYIDKDLEKLTEEDKAISDGQQESKKINKYDNKISDEKKMSKDSEVNVEPRMSQSAGDISTRRRKFLEGSKLASSLNSMKRTFSDGMEKLKKIVKG